MGIGTTELIVILVIILIIFGVGKLPEVGAGLGKGLREFKKATKDDKEIPAPAVPESKDETKNPSA
ncbi:MAG: twin-arginine translocase TatA/TatE family subunit [Deltaproteobacteria bacterium]|nr:twin-arginine translocase TatA/TatE family subunit [Deltaproteobacteria bacterium]